MMEQFWNGATENVQNPNKDQETKRAKYSVLYTVSFELMYVRDGK